MKIGISGTEYVREPDSLTELLRQAHLVGARYVEIWYPENFGGQSKPDDGREVGSDIDTRLDAALDLIDDVGVPIGCVSSGSELGVEDAEGWMVLLNKAIRLAARIGAPVVNSYFGGPGVRDDRRTIDRYARNISDSLDLAHSLGVTVVLENEFDAFGHDPEHGDPSRRPESLRMLVDTIDHDAFGLNFDAANMVCAGVGDVLGAFDLLHDAVRYAHIKDVRPIRDQWSVPEGWTAYRDGDRWYSTCTVGSGTVPWNHLLPRLLATVSAVTVEPHAAPANRSEAFVEAMHVLGSLIADTHAGDHPIT